MTNRIAERDWLDGRDEVGIQSIHVAPFSHVSRHGPWMLAVCFTIPS